MDREAIMEALEENGGNQSGRKLLANLVCVYIDHCGEDPPNLVLNDIRKYCEGIVEEEE